MKRPTLAGLLMTVLLFLPPLIFAPATAAVYPGRTAEKPTTVQTETSAPRRDADVVVRVWDGERVVERTLADYLPGVVSGEMPATFEPAALAAQAVAELFKAEAFEFHINGQRLHDDCVGSPSFGGNNDEIQFL